MPFDQTPVRGVTVGRRDAELVVAWDSAAPAGAWHHVYLDRVRVASTRRRYAVLPMPTAAARVEVGAVPSAERHRDLSAGLPAVPGGGSRLLVGWLGGTFLGASIAGFRVYTGAAPGGPVDYSAPAATVAAYPQGITLDGFGQGGFGQGGFGLAASSYAWRSGPVRSGSWAVAVVPFDSAGDAGTGYAWAVTVSGPPAPPARAASGVRLSYALSRGPDGGFGSGGFGQGGFGIDNAGFGVGGFGLGDFGSGEGEGEMTATLTWLASPGS